MSILGKLFSMIMYDRLLKWSNEYNIFIENQYGFLPERSTIDCIFILHAIISKYISAGQQLFCAFVDFKKAFDKIQRNILWNKLISYGVSTKMLNMLRSIYSSVKICVKHNGVCSDFFNSYSGVKQGEPLSPLLFLLFINDINKVGEDCIDLFDIDNFNIFSLLFADDTVLFAKSKQSLQLLLNNLFEYCIDNSIEVNTDKTKTIVFKKGNKPIKDLTITYDNVELECVDNFIYLGVTLFFNGKWNITQKRICEVASRAMYNILDMSNTTTLSTKLKCKVFDSMVSSIANYGSEVWGFHPAECIEKMHYKFCKLILGVKKTTCNAAILCELGRLPFYITRKIKIVKYWIKILKNKNNLLYSSYKMLRHDADVNNNYKGLNWASNVKSLFESLGLSFMWYDQDVSIPNFTIVKQRLYDQFIQSLFSTIESADKLCTFRQFKCKFIFEKYFDVIKEKHLLNNLTRFRLSSHPLLIETGRYENIPRMSRLCKYCNMKVIENEYHFLLVCPAYIDIRKHCLPKYYCHWPNMHKFVSLLSSQNNSIIYKIARYIDRAFKQRSNLTDQL